MYPVSTVYKSKSDTGIQKIYISSYIHLHCYFNIQSLFPPYLSIDVNQHLHIETLKIGKKCQPPLEMKENFILDNIKFRIWSPHGLMAWNFRKIRVSLFSLTVSYWISEKKSRLFRFEKKLSPISFDFMSETLKH